MNHGPKSRHYTSRWRAVGAGWTRVLPPHSVTQAGSERPDHLLRILSQEIRDHRYRRRAGRDDFVGPLERDSTDGNDGPARLPRALSKGRGGSRDQIQTARLIAGVLRGGAVDRADRDVGRARSRGRLDLRVVMGRETDDGVRTHDAPHLLERQIVLADVDTVSPRDPRDVGAVVD